MSLFKRRKASDIHFDPQTQIPTVRKSICTGEMTVGFIDKASGKFTDLMCVDAKGLEAFMREIGVEEVKTIY